MNHLPLISVIMSVHNHEAFVRAAVESVLVQSFADWELILINNGSTDKSPAIIDELAQRDARIVKIHQHDMGLAGARNRGLRQARGPWIAYLDSDDLWLPGALQAFADYIVTHPEAAFIFGEAHRLRDGRITPRPSDHGNRPVGTRELFNRMFLTPLTVCHRRALWDRVGGFDPNLRWCDDYDLFLRMSLLVPLEPIGAVVGLRRRHGHNMSARTGASQQAEAEVLRHFAAVWGANTLDERQVRRRLGKIYERASRCYLRERAHEAALATAEQAIALAPTWRGRMLHRWCTWLAPRPTRSATRLTAPVS